MVNLNLNDYSAPQVSEEGVRESYAKCQRALRLLQSKDFIQWRSDVEKGKERHIRRLIGKTESEGADRLRGIITAIEKLYSELETQASQIEQLAARLETYEQRKPVDQRNWIR